MYQFLPFRLGAARPAGWLSDYMKKDLAQGFIGCLDELVPALISDCDIYGRDRLGQGTGVPDLGVAHVPDQAALAEQYKWWNSETQSNWLDGLYRTAVLVDDAQYRAKAEALLEKRLETQEPDGYMGIYHPDARFSVSGENGELWAQSTLLRALFAYYEAGGGLRVLRAVQNAVEAVMRAFPENSSPFGVPGGETGTCGLCHGLTFTDTLENLYRATGDSRYLDYAVFLYDDYCRYPLSEPDIRLQNLLGPQAFQGHGAHTYEHLRTLAAVCRYQGRPAHRQALKSYLQKLDGCLCPSGAPIGDEWVGGRTADAAATGYEYCSIHELLHSYTSLLALSGDFCWADKAEWLLYNAAMGARDPEQPGASYLNTDNAYRMTGTFQLGDDETQTRYKYSPVHQDTAVCCIPNAGRIFPYFVQSMWLADGETLVKAMYGPGSLTLEDFSITEETRYPFGDTVVFTVRCKTPVEKRIRFRKPAFTQDVQLDGAPIAEEDGDLLTIQSVFRDGDQIRLRFTFSPRLQTAANGEYYYTCGPLLMVYPIPHIRTQGRRYPKDGFCDSLFTPADPGAHQLWIPAQGQTVTMQRDPDCGFCLQADFLDEAGQTKPVRLLPMAGNILRRATFPLRG